MPHKNISLNNNLNHNYILLYFNLIKNWMNKYSLLNFGPFILNVNLAVQNYLLFLKLFNQFQNRYSLKILIL
jgi:hypothetical protein